MKGQRISIGWMRISESGSRQMAGDVCAHMPERAAEKSGERMSRASACGRKLLRVMLRDECGIEISGERECISRKKGGKPFLVNHPGIYFNISHSGDYAACAVGEVPMGIDIQYHKKGDHRKLARRIMTPEEWLQYESSGFREEVLFRTWTRKESYLKYTGEGIRRELNTLTCDACRFLEWELWPGYSGMLCVPEKWEGEFVIREIKEDES